MDRSSRTCFANSAATDGKGESRRGIGDLLCFFVFPFVVAVSVPLAPGGMGMWFVARRLHCALAMTW